MKYLFLVLLFAGVTLSAQTIWYVNSTLGSDANNGLSCGPAQPGTGNGPKATITGLFTSAGVQNGDKIYIAAGTYNDHPTITKNVTIAGYSQGSNHVITFNCFGGEFKINTTGTVLFTSIATCNETKATQFRFHTASGLFSGIYLQHGDIRKTTFVDFLITGPSRIHF